MKIQPVLTEKSLVAAREGWYSFVVGKGFDKGEIKSAIEKMFDVHVREIRTMNYKALTKKTMSGRAVRVPASKKVLVRLSEKEKIDLFEEEGKKKK